jgi:hypothetical protein
MATPVRLPRRLLLLVVALLATLSPTVPGTGAAPSSLPVASAAARLVGPLATGTVRTSPGAARGVDQHRSAQPVLARSTSPGAAPADSTPAHIAAARPPVLLLVERPRPPSVTHPASAVAAPTGRAPPVPTGT